MSVLAEKITEKINRHATAFLVLVVILTAVLSLPILFMKPSSSASQEPEGVIFQTRDLAEERFASSIHRMVYIVEARNGRNLFEPAVLRELFQNQRKLRRDPSVGPKLASLVDERTGREFKGLSTIADSIDGLLKAQGIKTGLAKATPADINGAVDLILSKTSPTEVGLSVATKRDEKTGRWFSPALVVAVSADNEQLGGGGSLITLGTEDTTKEEYSRDVLALLRGDTEFLDAWGLALDVNLTSAEQGRSAGPYIGMTLFVVLMLLALTFRSYWFVAITGFALGSLMIWLRGLSNLIGFKSDIILDIIVPIAMISFGIDYAFHALGRYREELAQLFTPPKNAFVVGLAGVFGALVVAMASDSVAFLSNTATGIESLFQFGVVASLATVASFVLLGVWTPLAVARIEQKIGANPYGIKGKIFSMVAAVISTMVAVASVMLSVFLLPWLGVLCLFSYLVVFILIPFLIQSKFFPQKDKHWKESEKSSDLGFLGSLSLFTAKARKVIVPASIVFSLFCAYLAHHVRPQFEVRDFFAHTTDFVVGLEKFDEHVGDQGGEPALVYIEADVTDPRTLRAFEQFVKRAKKLDTQRFARSDNGEVQIKAGVLDLVDHVMASEPVKARLEKATTVPLTDEDGDGLPDGSRQLASIFTAASTLGIPEEQGQKLIWSPEKVATILWNRSEDDSADENGIGTATKLEFRIPGSRVQENIEEARQDLEPLIGEFQASLREHDPQARAVLTGNPIARQASLDAILWAFRMSLPVAFVLCFLVAAVFMRSVRDAAVSIIPVMMVAAWLYAAMYVLGYSINVVTATIGALSIGIGIDFSVHFTMRYREEMARTRKPDEALRNAGNGTGKALAASALSSVVGFSILAFAPMPMFASYGFLTALMIGMALCSSLIVLPALLFIVSPKKR